MQPRSQAHSTLTSKRIAIAVCAATALTLALVPLSATAGVRATTKLKLPAERTSPTGNFFTLEVYVAPTSSKPVAEFEVKVCTSAHTPADTAIEPSFFTLSLAQGGSLHESIAVAKSPALVPKPLKPLQCDEGWLGFSVPKGKSVSKLEYEFNGTISWVVG